MKNVYGPSFKYIFSPFLLVINQTNQYDRFFIVISYNDFPNKSSYNIWVKREDPLRKNIEKKSPKY